MFQERRPILYVDHASALGGAELSLLLILKHIDRSRWSPHLACVEGDLAREAQDLGVVVHNISLPRLRRSIRFALDWTGTARQLARIITQSGAVLVHSNTVRATLYAALGARMARRPLLWHMRDFWLGEEEPQCLWLDRWGKRLLCGLSAQIVTNSHAVRRHLPCERRVHVIHNGIDTEWYLLPSDGRQFRHECGISDQAPVVGMVGRLRPWKGQETFLQVAALIGEKLPATHFLVVGGNPFQGHDRYSEHLRRVAGRLALADRVTFTGHLEDIRPALAAMDVFVHPGSPEPFGLVNIEAMAMAKPVVAYAHGALPEIVVDGETGILVQPEDGVALANAILFLLQNRHTALAMGKEGRQRAMQSFQIHRTISALDALYTSMVSD